MSKLWCICKKWHSIAFGYKTYFHTHWQFYDKLRNYKSNKCKAFISITVKNILCEGFSVKLNSTAVLSTSASVLVCGSFFLYLHLHRLHLVSGSHRVPFLLKLLLKEHQHTLVARSSASIW